MKRRMYLQDIPLDVALDRFWEALSRASALDRMPAERVTLDDALGRVTAAPVWALVSSPHYHGAAMDGVAVRAEETVGASETSPLRLTLHQQAKWVDTGDPLPPDANAVIMLEHLQVLGDESVEIMAPVAPWQHVRPMGEDIVATELVLPAGRVLDAVDVGAAAAGGLVELEVRRKPHVAVLPTGTEIVPPGTPLTPGDIIDSNSLVLAGQVRTWGGDATRYPPTPDVYEQLRANVLDALGKHDVVVMNAGSSAGSADFTARLLEELGELVVHGVAIRPGHPLVLGVARGKPFLGIPGYPVSAVVTSELFLRPLLCRLLGITLPARETLRATLTRKVLSPMGEDEFLRVKLGKVGGRVIAMPLQRGAGVLMSMVRADGIVRLPRFSEGEHAGADVQVELLRSRESVERTIVAIGSHDLALDLLSDALARRAPGWSLSSSNVGSLGGLIALQRGECHVAGSHLLDEETGDYNVSYVQRYLRDRRVVLLTLVHRDQGLIVSPGNPTQVRTLGDLARRDVRFVNRQRGAGTRVLLDYKLKQAGIEPAAVQGYEREEYTHLGVAAAVASGVANAGMGILAAARALKLDFVPLLQERYDLVIPREFFEADLLAPLLEIIRGSDFRAAVEALGGYDTRETGQVAAEL